MNITEISHKIKAWITTNTGQTILIIVILIISNISSFYLGMSADKSTDTSSISEVQNTGDYSLADPKIYQEGSLAAAVNAASKTAKIAPNSSNITQNVQVAATDPNDLNNTAPRYVASKNGRVYYFTWCAGGKKILPENRVYFQTAQDARGAGLTPSTACEGLD